MLTVTNLDCVISAEGTEVFPNSATTNFIVLYQSTCAEGEITDGITTGTTITKVGKDGVDKIIMTAIPKKGSIFKGWTQDSWRANSNTYYGSPTTLSYNATIRNNTTWYALFDKDCTYIDIPFCFSTDITKLCLSCEEQKTVYFNNINNQFINNGSNINTSSWFSSTNFETLITYSSIYDSNRIAWSFNLSSAGTAGAGTFTDVSLGGFWTGWCDCCRNNIDHKYLAIDCIPSIKNISYSIFLYTNGVKTATHVRTGDSYINLINYSSDPNQYNNTYKITYLVNGNMTLSTRLIPESIFHYSDCFGGGDNSFSTSVYTRADVAGSYTPNGYYTQLINGQYSNYTIIYRVYNGQVIQVLDCRSDILDCNG